MTQRETAKVLRWTVKRVRRWTVAGLLPHDRDPETNWPVYTCESIARKLADMKGAA
jgi:hypothetical protein